MNRLKFLYIGPDKYATPGKNDIQLAEDEVLLSSCDAQHYNTGGPPVNNSSENNEMSNLSPTPVQKYQDQKKYLIKSPPAPSRGMKSVKNNNNNDQIRRVEQKKKKPQECSATESVPVIFDPYDIVENIADLTVEHLKESLLGEKLDENNDQFNNNVVKDHVENGNHNGKNEIPETPKRSKSKKIQEPDLKITPPTRNKSKTKNNDTNDETSASISIDETSVSSTLDECSASSRSETPSKKKCRLRVVKKNQEDSKPKQHGGKENINNEDKKVSFKMEEEKIVRTSKSVLTSFNASNDQNNLRDSSSKKGKPLAKELVSEDKCVMNDLDTRKKESVNIPIRPITKLETVKTLTRNEETNGHLCRQTQGRNIFNTAMSKYTFFRYSEKGKIDSFLSLYIVCWSYWLPFIQCS